ncbi:transposase [Ktedonobacter sp. SOSP1-85]|uniref:ISL3 family transposase n=1 Tax=Ktedonobacter sp. SOSP1-85 TaxID=2778367 RepID=UPI001914FF28|nr:ISL3 family transposase [Ktedonobacter sp. SOSP1-85]GHO80264.1 transposase [Ktedonobacter sp. SOSP1-85]
MEENPLLPLPEGIQIDRIQASENEVRITAIATHPTSCCPVCRQPSCTIHSRYRRMVRDVPCGGRRVQLTLCVRKFFCRNPLCERKVFTERLPELVCPWAQVTIRYSQQLTSIGLATCGKEGTRLAACLGIQTSRQTILRRIMDLPDLPLCTVLYLGIDDFVFPRGCRFGTILVNLESRRVVDLLPDREAETSAAWMRQQPDLMVVSLDRGGEYASAAREGAPQAIQCADRFHLKKNLKEAVEGFLARHFAAHRTRVVQESRVPPLPAAQGKGPPKWSPKQAAVSQTKREERLAQYEHVAALRKQGFSQTAIASQVGIGHATVSRWLAQNAFPERQPSSRKTRLDPYLKEVAQRWEAGCHNIAQLHREFVAHGAPLIYKVVYKQLVRSLPEGRKTAAAPDQLPRPPVLARQAVFLFLRRPEELSAEEEETLALLRSLHTEMDQAYELVQQFTQMLPERRGMHLDTWLAQVNQSNIPELRSFAAGVEKDKEAVGAGLTWWINNGIVEGHVTTLKLIKRSMYGRAGFPLLRQRVLHAV